jgi:UDP-N-acetyl-2-amino-2-deoxyglucuronate dehydrogenase
LKNRKLKFVLVGCGYIGKRHAEVLLQHPDCELVALVDNNQEKLSEFNHLNLPFFQTFADCFASVETDVAIVATPNGTHAQLAIEALQNGKHVLIEKPMALKKPDAEAIVKKAAEANRQVMVVLQNRFSPVSKWLKELVASNVLGRLFFVEVNCFWNRDERYYTAGSWHGTADMDGGCLFTQFSHFIDTLYWLFGDVKNVGSRFYNFRHQYLASFEDTGTIHFEFENGGAGCFNFSTAAWDKNMESSLTFLTEKGSVKVSGQYMDRVEFLHVKDQPTVPVISTENTAGNHHYQLIDALVNAIKNNSGTNAIDALRTVDIIERMYASTSKNIYS